MFLKQTAGSKKNRGSIFSRIQSPKFIYSIAAGVFCFVAVEIILFFFFHIVTKATLQSRSSHKAFRL